MGKNIYDKIISDHMVEGKAIPGEPVSIRIDQTLTQDATGTMAFLEFEAMGMPRVKTKLSVSYVDHNMLQDGYENADDHRYLQSAARKYGAYFSRPGNGICHQVHLERFGVPGEILIGSDSHTPTNGGIGMMAMGAGGLDVAVAMAGEPFNIIYPRVIKINLTKKLRPWVTAKDVILKVLEILTSKGNVGYAVEYGGEGISSLSVPERATITNMGAELGVTTSIFPSDEVTRKFLKAQSREESFKQIKPDDDAEYKKIIDIDLSQLDPLIASPHSPDNIRKASVLAGLKINQVCIGSCTNSSYVDIRTVAEILKDKPIHPDVSLVITVGSRQVLQMLSREGYLASLIKSGARIGESACSFCIGLGFAPPSGGVSLRTINRNFPGRSGTPDAEVYLCSPPVAALSALAGELVNPLNSSPDSYPFISVPEKFEIVDNMIIPPTPETGTIEIIKGPNIGEPPISSPMGEEISGEVIIKVEDKISTDIIAPAGWRLKYRSNIAKYAEFCFEPLDSTFPNRCKENKEKNIDNIIVAGLSYGQGSSREHAAICPRYLNVKAVIAKSIERIHGDNLVNFGIIPLFFKNNDDWLKIDQGDKIIISDLKSLIKNSDIFPIMVTTRNLQIEAICRLTERQREIIFYGGMLNYIKENRGKR